MAEKSIAKRFLLGNVSSNVLNIVVSTAIGFWLTPYLIAKLGLAVYGMIPLVNSIVRYFEFGRISITGSLARFVSLALYQEDDASANVYFNTAFFALLALHGVIFLLGLLFAPLLPHLFQVPAGSEHSVSFFFVITIASSAFIGIRAPFDIGTFHTHRFYIASLLTIAGRAVQVLLLVALFTFFAARLEHFGWAYLTMNVFLLLGMARVNRRLSPQLRIKWPTFSRGSLMDLAGMGVWNLIDSVGSLLYLSIDFIVINLLLGPLMVGYYGPVAQLATMTIFLSDAFVRVFAPVAYEHLAKSDSVTLFVKTLQSIKFMGMIMAIPIGLLCGFSRNVLTIWLGEAFAPYHLLIWLLVGVRIATITVSPLFSITLGLNKVRYPAVATITGGIVNLVLSVAFVKWAGMGILGVALATAISLAGKNLVFMPLYCARIMGTPLWPFYRNILTGCLSAATVAAMGLFVAAAFPVDTLARLVFFSLPVIAFASLATYYLFMNADDRAFVLSLAPWRR